MIPLVEQLASSLPRRELVLQLLRYALSGAAITLLGTAIYLALVLYTPVHAQWAVFIASVICLLVGFVTHSRWTFQGHGSRDRPAGMMLRFVLVSLFGYGLNAFATWVATVPLRLPDWAAVVPMVLLTPLVVFAINRNWVFR